MSDHTPCRRRFLKTTGAALALPALPATVAAGDDDPESRVTVEIVLR